MRINSWALQDMPGSSMGYSHAIFESDSVLSLKGPRATPIHADSLENELNTKESAPLQRKLYFDFLHTSTLIIPKRDTEADMQLLERLFLLCAMESKGGIAAMRAYQPLLGEISDVDQQGGGEGQRN